MIRLLIQSTLCLLVLTLLVGIVYPLIVTGIACVVFPHQAHGSLIERDGQVVGSELIGQPFTNPRHFWGRPSATTRDSKPWPYDGLNSGGSNLGPTNPDLGKQVADRVAALRAADPGNTQPVPVDLVTASGSGLDPDISPAAAEYQVPRVARENQSARRRPSATWCRPTPTRGAWASSASPGSTCSNSIWR